MQARNLRRNLAALTCDKELFSKLLWTLKRRCFNRISQQNKIQSKGCRKDLHQLKKEETSLQKLSPSGKLMAIIFSFFWIEYMQKG